jgi:hypothetical protein
VAGLVASATHEQTDRNLRPVTRRLHGRVGAGDTSTAAVGVAAFGITPAGVAAIGITPAICLTPAVRVDHDR